VERLPAREGGQSAAFTTFSFIGCISASAAKQTQTLKTQVRVDTLQDRERQQQAEHSAVIYVIWVFTEKPGALHEGGRRRELG
jgi:hypothetical protein